MSHSNRREFDDYDYVYGTSSSDGSPYIQITLPSARIEVPPGQILYKQHGGKPQEIKAKNVKPHNLLYVSRDDEQTTEGVLEVKKVYREALSESDVSDGMIIVNNVIMKSNR